MFYGTQTGTAKVVTKSSSISCLVLLISQRYADSLGDELRARGLRCDVDDLAARDPEETLIQEAQHCSVCT